MRRRRTWVGCLASILLIVVASTGSGQERRAVEPPSTPHEVADRFLERYCIDCHNAGLRTADFNLDELDSGEVARNSDAWEKVVRRLAAREMPPGKRPRPSESEYDSVLSALVGGLDRAAEEHPNPGKAETFRRLTRTEYQNAIRDLLGLEIDASALLPPDESSRGFDNITVGDLSPTLLDRYLTAAQKISRLAVGSPGGSADGETIRIRADVTQEEHVEGLPLGTRGGALITHVFPRDGEYEVQLRLARDRNEHVEGLREPQELELMIDRESKARFTVDPPKSDADHQTADAHLKARIHISAGTHRVGTAFVKQASSLMETKRQPYQAHYNMHRHPRLTPALYQISIIGPLGASDRGETPSRRLIFVRRPSGPEDEETCAREILATLTRRAYRRPVADADLRKPLELYREARESGDFETGIEAALSAVLVNPQFFFRIETSPPGAPAGSTARLPDVPLASRLSFFLWSSIPDDELLDLAERGELGRPEVLRAQVRRMLADPRSRSLTTNFAGQWLHLRNLDSITPDLRLFPDFDDNLRQAFRRETELLFEEIVREDRSVIDLIASDHAYLNERLARHYGIPHVQGSRFRRVDLGENHVRGGLLRQGSVLMATSYATRTSPVIRGKWVLENLLGTPPPPPPADVPALKENSISSSLSVRERLAEHRANTACASCHDRMDPVGFALENFDAVGRWRTMEEGRPVDATGGLPDGSRFEGVEGLEQALRKRPELFVGTLTEKLLTFALGRGVDPSDAPAVRKIVREARGRDYRFSSIVEAVAASTPFQMRRAE
ncbi:DUF1592 domain-containing protein [Paludisphaera rhizosphaerae]|uniref:DUF1592 domain-containing protein n=1 Tax=Paludisphaera rhizosphaerae TaxID=2711216 RepID=UPI0013EB1D3B|nr:DUF1592 domain-containing protein [Paludisphaera rhizosphaerae]